MLQGFPPAPGTASGLDPAYFWLLHCDFVLPRLQPELVRQLAYQENILLIFTNEFWVCMLSITKREKLKHSA